MVAIFLNSSLIVWHLERMYWFLLQGSCVVGVNSQSPFVTLGELLLVKTLGPWGKSFLT